MEKISSPPNQDSSDHKRDGLICDVERGLIEEFLILVRDNYKKADKAHFFLQRHTQTTNVHGVANLRDILSHLAAMLDPEVPPDKKRDQLTNAQEHFRRAILEPYETSLNARILEFEKLFSNYKERVIPNQDRYPMLVNAPTAESIQLRLAEINELAERGKAAKRMNVLDQKWEGGVADFIEGYATLAALYTAVEEYWNRFKQLDLDGELEAERKRSKARSRIFIIWASLATLTAMILLWLLIR